MPLKLSVVSPDGDYRNDAVDSVVLPGIEGDFGVLPSHERFLTALRIGEVEIKSGSETLLGAISGGFAAIEGEEVVVMVESGEFAGDIDVARAEVARQRAEQQLAQLDADEDKERYTDFEAALERAKNRLEVSKKNSGSA